MNRRIKDALITILSGITYDTGLGEEPAFVSVLDNTKDEFEGYPAIRILPNNLSSVIDTNAQNNHTVSFAVIMHFPLNSPDEVESSIYDRMYDLTDLIVDTAEHADYIDELSTIDSAIQNWLMVVKQGRWYIANGKAGSLLLCNLDIEVSYSKDVY
ncbi:hypothetical protein B5P43_18465 [Bacillus sp. SRB_336]|nr:hypothetical protein B5P43_18465 [Bacillus sp. SRB_336]